MMLLAILFSLKTMKSLQNGVATHFQPTPFFSMRTVQLVSSQSCCSVEADAGVNGPLHDEQGHTVCKKYTGDIY